MPTMNYNGKRVVVLGLGLSGLEAARLLHDHGAEVTVRDDGAASGRLSERAEVLRGAGMKVELGAEISADTRFDLAVLSPGIDPKRPLVRTLKEAGVPLIGELELASRFCACDIVAITGTNGKTTTTELVDSLLRAGGKKTAVSGNIGRAFSAEVRRSAELDVMVLEVSSFQLEQVAEFRPHVSVHLNLTPDHLDRYATMDEYEKAKWEIFRNQTPADFAVVNANLRLPEVKAKTITFSTDGAVAEYEWREGWLAVRGEKVYEQKRSRLIGRHNAENMLAALAVADLYQVPRAAAAEAFTAYRPLPHRCEKIAEIGGVLFLNDSKATNIDALEKALIAMDRPVVLLAGGKDKGLDFGGLRTLVRAKVKAAVLIGQMTEKLAATWQADTPCHRAVTLAEAVKRAQELARSGDAVLFSPGCSSYDMFKDFEDRGNQFRDLVLNLAPRD
jgi:UDP-N-acetylmuramoylalanine--D-glutamate ligase